MMLNLARGLNKSCYLFIVEYQELEFSVKTIIIQI